MQRETDEYEENGLPSIQSKIKWDLGFVMENTATTPDKSFF